MSRKTCTRVAASILSSAVVSVSLVAALIVMLLTASCSEESSPTGTGGVEHACIDYSDYLHVAGSCETPANARGTVVLDGYAYVADGASGLQIIDVSDPSSPHIVGSIDTPDGAYDVAVS
jgi:hypothetical protein